jgi:hypothetical protein
MTATRTTMNSEFSITPIVGWRAWVVDVANPIQPQLVSLTRAIVWPARTELVAVCEGGHVLHHNHENVIDPRCSCGIYGARTLVDLHALGFGIPPRYLDDEPEQPLVVGTVALWGRVIEGPRGYRGQRAYPRELHIAHVHWRHAIRLQATYGIPVRLANPHKLIKGE